MASSREWPAPPQIDESDITAVVDILRSGHLSQLSSKAVDGFEADLASYHGVDACVAVSSGTAAIHLALLALGIGPGDEVAVPSHTFIGSASPILHVGATPVFIDVDEQSYCMDPTSLAERITPTTRAVIVVHLNGRPADIDALQAVAAGNGATLIEDAAQAIGACHAGRPVGTFGLLGCFSFFESKNITTAEGGAVVTSDEALAARMRRLRQHGEDQIEGTRHYHSAELGLNYRLTAIQAALGRSQLRRLDDIVQTNQRSAERFGRWLQVSDRLGLPDVEPGDSGAWWKYVFRLDTDEPSDASALIARLQKRGVPAQRRYPIPLHRQPVFEGRAKHMDCPITDRLSEALVSLPVTAMSEADVDEMAQVVLDEFRAMA